MIAVAVAVIAGVVAVTCGIVADSNHADTLAFLGVMVKTTAAQIFLSGAICTWALFAALWLLSLGVRRSKQRTLELRALRAGVAFAYDDTAAASAAVQEGDAAAWPDAAGHAAPAAVPVVTRHVAPPVPPFVALPNLGEEPTLTDDAFADGTPAREAPGGLNAGAPGSPASGRSSSGSSASGRDSFGAEPYTEDL